MWRQKSKVGWQQMGDQNMLYFHKVALCRKRFNIIVPAMVGLRYEVPLSAIKYVITAVFRNPFA